MPKGSFLDDTFEKLVELGTSTAKKTVKSVKQTLTEFNLSSSNNTSDPKEQQAKKPNSTKLDLEGLNKKYQDQDKQKQEALRQKLFQLVKSGEEKAIQEKKKEQKEKEQKLIYEEQEKKRREAEKKQQTQAEIAPKGKERKSIFGKKKKKAIPTAAEIKPSVGKQ